MNWLDRARARLPESQIREKFGNIETSTANTAENPISAVSAVPVLGNPKKSGRCGSGENTDLGSAPPQAYPVPSIACEPPFGGVSPCHEAAWKLLCSECPPGTDPAAWQAAVRAAASMLSFWGAELARLGWTSADLFECPDGLIWWLRGDSVAAVGPAVIITQCGRIFARHGAPAQRAAADAEGAE